MSNIAYTKFYGVPYFEATSDLDTIREWVQEELFQIIREQFDDLAKMDGIPHIAEDYIPKEKVQVHGTNQALGTTLLRYADQQIFFWLHTPFYLLRICNSLIFFSHFNEIDTYREMGVDIADIIFRKDKVDELIKQMSKATNKLSRIYYGCQYIRGIYTDEGELETEPLDTERFRNEYNKVVPEVLKKDLLSKDDAIELGSSSDDFADQLKISYVRLILQSQLFACYMAINITEDITQSIWALQERLNTLRSNVKENNAN